MVSGSRLSLLAPLALMLAVSPLAPAWAQAGDDADEDAAPEDRAHVKIELKQPSGKVLKYEGALLDWGADGNVSFKYDDHVHDVSLRIDRANESAKAISLTVGYSKDGQAIIAPQTVDSELKKREVIKIEGGVAIAITVSPKAAKAEEPPPPPEEPQEKEQPKKKRIVGGDANDPLDGLK